MEVATGTAGAQHRDNRHRDLAIDPDDLGGAQDEQGRGLARGGDGGLYVAGVTFSATTGSSQSDAFVSKIVPGGGSAPPATPAPYDETYAYDTIGNLTSKAGIASSYGATGNGTGAGPHQARTVGVQTSSYDANGNLLSGGGRTLTWDTENRPSSVTATGGTETYTYDADGERVTKTTGGVTTSYYLFNGPAVGMHGSVTNQVISRLTLPR